MYLYILKFPQKSNAEMLGLKKYECLTYKMKHFHIDITKTLKTVGTQLPPLLLDRQAKMGGATLTLNIIRKRCRKTNLCVFVKQKMDKNMLM